MTYVRQIYNIIIYENPPLNTLVWGSLRLAPIMCDFMLAIAEHSKAEGGLTYVGIVCVM